MGDPVREALRGLVAAVEADQCDCEHRCAGFVDRIGNVFDAVKAAQAGLGAGEQWTDPAVESLTDGTVPTIFDLCASLDGALHGSVIARPYSQARRWRELLTEVADLRARLAACGGALRQNSAAILTWQDQWRAAVHRADQAERERDEAVRELEAVRVDGIKTRAGLYAALEDAQTQRVRESHANTDLARANRDLLARADQADARRAALAQPPSDAAVERVAKALHRRKCQVSSAHQRLDCREFDELPERHRDEHRDEARAALAAWREGV